jgi:hypothetical protein
MARSRGSSGARRGGPARRHPHLVRIPRADGDERDHVRAGVHEPAPVRALLLDQVLERPLALAVQDQEAESTTRSHVSLLGMLRRSAQRRDRTAVFEKLHARTRREGGMRLRVTPGASLRCLSGDAGACWASARGRRGVGLARVRDASSSSRGARGCEGTSECQEPCGWKRTSDAETCYDAGRVKAVCTHALRWPYSIKAHGPRRSRRRTFWPRESWPRIVDDVDGPERTLSADTVQIS